MSIWGKIIGGATGVALGGPLGALFGALAGHAVARPVEADGRVQENELAYLAEAARIFGFTEGDFARIREANLGADKADPYTILGVTREMSNEEIRAAWRKLVRDNHPDRLMSQGLPAEFV